jgi:hypothetical protein
MNGQRGNWLITLNINGFMTKIAVYGYEEEVRDYINSEIPEKYLKSYVGMRDSDVSAWKSLRLPIYMAPDDYE